jgi:hypothetical protein
MGMIFTGPETQRVLNRLNRRFNDDNISKIRVNQKKLAKFTDPTRTLARIAYKSGCYPGTAPSDDVAKRWFYFLHNLDGGVAGQIQDALNHGLTDTLDNGDPKYVALSFVAFEGPALVFDTEDIAQVDAMGNPTGYCVMLFKLQTQEIGANKFDASTPDANEASSEPNDGPDS